MAGLNVDETGGVRHNSGMEKKCESCGSALILDDFEDGDLVQCSHCEHEFEFEAETKTFKLFYSGPEGWPRTDSVSSAGDSIETAFADFILRHPNTVYREVWLAGGWSNKKFAANPNFDPEVVKRGQQEREEARKRAKITNEQVATQEAVMPSFEKDTGWEILCYVIGALGLVGGCFAFGESFELGISCWAVGIMCFFWGWAINCLASIRYSNAETLKVNAETLKVNSETLKELKELNAKN
jgi:hypothetical protein